MTGPSSSPTRNKPASQPPMANSILRGRKEPVETVEDLSLLVAAITIENPVHCVSLRRTPVTNYSKPWRIGLASSTF